LREDATLLDPLAQSTGARSFREEANAARHDAGIIERMVAKMITRVKNGNGAARASRRHRDH
jgi:hypothetical protein